MACANFAHTTRHGAIAGKTQVKEVGLDMKRLEKPILVTRPCLPPMVFYYGSAPIVSPIIGVDA